MPEEKDGAGNVLGSGDLSSLVGGVMCLNGDHVVMSIELEIVSGDEARDGLNQVPGHFGAAPGETGRKRGGDRVLGRHRRSDLAFPVIVAAVSPSQQLRVRSPPNDFRVPRLRPAPQGGQVSPRPRRPRVRRRRHHARQNDRRQHDHSHGRHTLMGRLRSPSRLARAVAERRPPSPERVRPERSRGRSHRSREGRAGFRRHAGGIPPPPRGAGEARGLGRRGRRRGY
mmetsp:Transcript_58790/g.174925  ORF Transcript_58790/g.174925 Transcript_58790/m.174925 type:complete len:227 (+) Transcript_58790:1110-1790(+)